METLYVVTHAIMTLCMIGIIGMSFPSATYGAKGSAVSNLILKVKPKRLATNSLYSKIAGLLAVFIG